MKHHLIRARFTILSKISMCLLATLVFCAMHTAGQEDIETSKPLKILWLGTSSSNPRLRNTLEIMLKKDGEFEEIKQDFSSFGIVTEKYLKPEGFRKAAQNKYDYIALQISSYSLRPKDVKEITPDVQKNVEYSLDRLKETGSKIILFESFALQNFKNKQPALNSFCRAQARKHNVLHVPTGTAWQQVVREKDWEYLIADTSIFNDWAHAGPRGTYLFASMFYSVITDQSPTNISSRTTKCRLPPDQGKYALQKTELPEEEAHYLQNVAETVLRDSSP